MTKEFMFEFVFAVLYDMCWPTILWLSQLLLFLSWSECLTLSDIGCNSLQRPTPLWHWELSCGLSLPPDPPWMPPRIRERKQPHFSFIQREHNQYQNSRNWKPHYRQEALDRIPWCEDTVPTAPIFFLDAFDTDRLLTRLDPLDDFHRLITLHNPSFLTITWNNQSHQHALVAATDLRATYKTADMSRFSKGASKPYVLHTVDDTDIPVVVDTGASVRVTPLVSDFVGPITKLSSQSLQGFGDSTKVDRQGIIEWQIRDALGTPIPPEPPPPLIRSSSEGVQIVEIFLI
jgi:hypothetical protein